MQVRSASFDEIQLEAQRNNGPLVRHQSTSEESPTALLQVPQVVSQQQRSKSFDSASTTTAGEDSSTFLEVPRRFQRRRSSNTKNSPPVCIHCQYLEEYRRQISADQLYFIDHQEVRTLSYSDTSSSEDDDSNDEESQQQFILDPDKEPLRTLHLPPPSQSLRFTLPEATSSPSCNIRFTLSPTTNEMPQFIDLESPPCTPYRIPSPPPPFINLARLTDVDFVPETLQSPTIPEDLPPPIDDFAPPAPRSRRRSISRQEAVFVEPTKDSLENVTGERTDADGRIPSIKSSDDDLDNENEYEKSTLFQHLTADNVCDIFLAVPDLKRDRAASVDSCFSKVSSSGKTEEVKPPPDGGLTLTVPTGSAVRSRSVDIVLPTDQQARYKALALAGPSNYGQYSKGYVCA